MNHPLRCECGKLQGYVAEPKTGARMLCYCKDCQAFAHFLGKADSILDAQGGTDIVPAAPANVHLTAGADQLACMRLTDKGLLRWYAKCCNTPIGNTPANLGIPYIGLVHNCLQYAPQPLASSFGPVRIWSFTKRAKGKVTTHKLPMIAGIIRVLSLIATERLKGGHKSSPFADAETFLPVVQPHVLTAQERDRIMRAVNADNARI